MSKEIEAIRAASALLSREGWTDDGATAVRLVRAASEKGVDLDRLQAAIPSTFLARNHVSAARVATAVAPVLRALDLGMDLTDVLLPMEAIDTFAKAASIDTRHVAGIAQPLALPEVDVKRYLAAIIGEPYLDQDWGGELSDLLTARVV